MSPVTTLAAYAGTLVVVFGAAMGVGAAVGPVGPAAPAHTADPRTADPRTEDPRTEDPHTEDPHTADDESHAGGTSSTGGAP